MTSPSRFCALTSLVLIATAHAQTAPPCPDVEIGAARTYACLNQRLNPAVPHAADPSIPEASDPANRTGLFNQAGTAERLGNSFGHSATPQRPPPISPGASSLR